MLPCSSRQDDVFQENATPNGSMNSSESEFLHPLSSNSRSGRYRPVSFLVMTSPITPAFPSLSPTTKTGGLPSREGELTFDSYKDLLDHVTRNWREDFVTSDLNTKALLEAFATRPFFMIVSVDAPMFTRYQRTVRCVI